MSFLSVFSFIFVVFLLRQNTECCQDRNAEKNKEKQGTTYLDLHENDIDPDKNPDTYDPDFRNDPKKETYTATGSKRNQNDVETIKSVNMEFLWKIMRRRNQAAVVLVPQMPNTYDRY